MTDTQPRLKRELGIFDATLIGLGSILGTGLFVSLAIASHIAGPAVILSVMLAAFIATCNGLNISQLAANHPVSGGTYEYGYEYLTPVLGFTAGWVFLLAKTASAASAALGFAGYLLNLFDINHPVLLIITAMLAVLVLTVIILQGIRRSNTVNHIIVSITLLAITVFILAGIPTFIHLGTTNFHPFFVNDQPFPAGLLEATALMFVAYSGYARITLIGEEVKEPDKTIPQAIIITLFVTMLIYVMIALISVGVGGSDFCKTISCQVSNIAPLTIIAELFNIPGISFMVAIGAISAMLGVLLNLILGLSRVVLAMGRRRDLPAFLAHINMDTNTPDYAIIAVSLAIASLVLIGNIKATWSFSAFNVLIYYSITNLASLRLSKEKRSYPRWLSVIGLTTCLFLAFWVETRVWLLGLGLIMTGLIWHILVQRLTDN